MKDDSFDTGSVRETAKRRAGRRGLAFHGNGRGSPLAFLPPLLGVALCALCAATARAQIPSDSLVLEGDYIRTGVSHNGTLGVGGRTSPGFIFDASGTGNFSTANDYLTPGTPQEGFSISYTGSGGVKLNNNASDIIQIGTSAAPTSVASDYDHAALWSGTIAGVLTIEHLYGLDDDTKQVQITTTITALTNLTDLEFARWIDPDSGGTRSENSRGNSTLGLAPEDWANSVSETNGATLGLYSSSSVAHNTAISPGWSTDPATYLAGSADMDGDYTIGIAFDVGSLNAGNAVVLEYSYAVAADPNQIDVELGEWIGGSDSDWDNVANWDPEEAATDGDHVRIASSGNPTINHNVTGNTYNGWEFTAACAQVTVSGNSVTLADGTSLDNNSAHLQTFDVAVIADGDLAVSAGSGGLDFQGIQIADGSTLTFDAGTATTNAVQGLISGNGSSLVKTGTGTLTLSGANTYSGGTTISAGTLRLYGGDNRLAAGSDVSIAGGATLDLDGNSQQIGSLNGAGSLTMGAGNLTVADGSFSGTITGTGALTKDSAGTLTLSGANTYSGGTTVSAGTLRLSGGDNRLAAGGDVQVDAGATLDLNGNSQQVGSLDGAGSLTLGAGNLTVADGSFSGAITGTGALTKDSAGTLTLSGANAYSGGTNVSAGTLRLSGGDNRLAAGGDVSIAGGATLDLDGNSQQVGSLDGTGSLTMGAGNLNVADGSFSGTISGTGALTKDSAGTLTLSGANTYSGGTNVSAGTLRLSGGDNRLAAGGDVQVDAGATLDLDGNSQQVGSLDGAGSLTMGAGNLIVDDGTFSGTISGTGALAKNSAGTLTLSGANTYSGGTNVSAGTLRLSGGDNRLAAGSDVQIDAGATLDLDGNSQQVASLGATGNIALGAGALTVADGTVSGTISGTGSLTKDSAGTLTLSGANTYSGGTTVSAGTLQLDGGDNRMAAGGDVQIDAGATLDLNGNSQQVGSLDGAGSLTMGAGNLTAADGTFSGTISGTGALTKDSAGTLILSGANTYSGGTNVSAGTLQLDGGDNRLAAGGNVQVDAGATLDFDGNSQQIGSLDGAGSLTLGAGNLTAADGTFSGAISGTGALTKDSAGTLTLSGANTYSGGTAITAGTLQLDGGDNRLAAGGDVQIDAGSTLDLNGNSQQVGSLDGAGNLTMGAGNLTAAGGTFSGTLSGTGALTKDSAGTLALSGANTYSGGTTLQQGTVVLDNDDALGSGTVRVTGNVTIDTNTGITSLNDWHIENDPTVTFEVGDVRVGDDLVINGEFSGAATLIKNGAGIVNITQATNFSATSTTINGGELILSTGQNQNIVNRGTLVIDENPGAGQQEFSGSISGTGNVVKTGGGTVLLTGQNTFTGGTTVQSGTLIGSAGNPGAGAVGSLPGAGDSNPGTEAVNVQAGATLAFNQGAGQNGQFTGSIGGAGAVVKAGTGALQFNGNIGAGTGGLTIQQGKLSVQGGTVGGWTYVQSGGTLGGSGHFTGGLHVQSGGVHAPGNSIGTDYTTNYIHDPGSTLEIEIDAAGNSDLVEDSGTVTINGGTVLVKPDAGTDPNDLRIGTEYTFITSTDPIQGAGFEEVAADGFQFPIVVLIREQYEYRLRLLGFHYISRTPNQASLGTWLDNSAIDGTADGDLQDMMAAIGGLDTFDQMRQAMEQLDGEVYPTLAIAGIQLTDQFYARLSRRIRPDGCTASAPSAELSAAGSQGWVGGVFGRGLGGNALSDGNAHGFHLSTGGGSAILGRQLDPNTDLGFVFDYERSYLNLAGMGQGSDVDTYRWGAYLLRKGPTGHWTAAGSFGYDHYDTTRVVDFGAGADRVLRVARADHEGWQGGAYLERGWNVNLPGVAVLQPLVALQYLHLRQNRIVESGADSFDLATGGLDLDSLRTRLGGVLNVCRFANAPVRFEAVWSHELLDETTGLVDNRLTGDTGDTTFLVRGVDLGRDWVTLGPRAELHLTPHANLFGAYDLSFNDRQAFHTGSGGLELTW